ncbi:MAG: hypothetical protein DI534_11900 [Leifsonia xyli]|nr:MAG: hypothetical protein DI534_11900 [Leifsonia xyli]
MVTFAVARELLAAALPDLTVGRHGSDTGTHWIPATGHGADDDGEPLVYAIGGTVPAVDKTTGAIVELQGAPANPDAWAWRAVYLAPSGELVSPPDFLA